MEITTMAFFSDLTKTLGARSAEFYIGNAKKKSTIKKSIAELILGLNNEKCVKKFLLYLEISKCKLKKYKTNAKKEKILINAKTHLKIADKGANEYFDVCEKACRYFVEIGQTWKKLGYYYYDRKKYSEALECIKYAIKIYPKNISFYQDLKKAVLQAHKNNPNGNYLNHAKKFMGNHAKKLELEEKQEEKSAPSGIYKQRRKKTKLSDHASNCRDELEQMQLKFKHDGAQDKRNNLLYNVSVL
jgi:tetratricopeptide (TPR) repeat protein